MVGDPLYRPYASWLDLGEKAETHKAASDWAAYHDFATKNSSLPAVEYRAAAKQFAARTRNAPMLEDIGLLEADAENYAGATGCFDLARTTYTKRDDILRVVLHEADGTQVRASIADVASSSTRTAGFANAARASAMR